MAAQGQSALHLWQARTSDVVTLRSGCDSIDDLLHGGFRSGLLTEICGEAGAGKTQLCLQLLLQAGLPKELGGLDGAACYVSTEGIGGIKRLHELGTVYNERYSSIMRKRRRTETASANAFLDNIFIEQVYDADALVSVVVRYCSATLNLLQQWLTILCSCNRRLGFRRCWPSTVSNWSSSTRLRRCSVSNRPTRSRQATRLLRYCSACALTYQLRFLWGRRPASGRGSCSTWPTACASSAPSSTQSLC